MSKYIDADRLYKDITRNIDYCEDILEIVERQTAADVEEVVRCKDCKHADLFYPYCTIWEAAIDGDGYCYKGEKDE